MTYLLYLGLPSTASVPLSGAIDWMHEGERMGTVQIVLAGGLPIRDVYLPHGLFPEVIRPLVAFGMFGESLAADRVLGLLIEPLAYVAAVYYLWKVFPTIAWRTAGLVGCALFPLAIDPRHIVVFLALGLLTAWAYERGWGRLFWAGLMTGLGFVISTFDHAALLLATVLLFPFTVGAERLLRQRTGAGPDSFEVASIRAFFFKEASPLFGGLIIGLIPFLSYMAFTGTAGLFIEDLVSRAESDFYGLEHVWHQTSYPPLNRMNLVWYLVPAFYGVLATVIIVDLLRHGERVWMPLLPTLLFGILSLSYAIRAFVFWKLAVVLFPFIIAVVYILYVMTVQQQDQTARQGEAKTLPAEKILLSFSGCAMIALLTASLTRDWTAKQVVPRFLFPLLSLVGLVATAVAATERFRARRWRAGLVVACPLAALIVGVWFCNDAKPAVVSALLKKPRFVTDVRRLITVMATADGRLTRDYPQFVQDETLTYLKAASREHRRVVILTPGAGIYYFLGGLSPPNRFPEINITLARGWAQEVVEGLDRTGADLLVACDDQGQRMRGWPILPILSRFIAANYMDSGQRLRSQMLAEMWGDCPFSVWVHRKTRNGTLMQSRGHSSGLLRT